MSEFSLIYQHFQHCTGNNPLTQVGIGDDCAISSMPSDCELVSCIDTLVAGRHFPFINIRLMPSAINRSRSIYPIWQRWGDAHAILLGISLPAKLAHDDWLKPFAQGIADIATDLMSSSSVAIPPNQTP